MLKFRHRQARLAAPGRLRRAVPAFIALFVLAVFVVGCGYASGDGGVSLGTPTSVPTQAVTRAPASTATAVGPAETCARATPEDSSAADILTLVDKERSLPADFEPADLVAVPDRLAVPGFPGQRMRSEAAEALVALLDAADSEGIELRARSTYRSYEEQIVTFQYWVDLLGEAQARRESAEPGHSEHQLGTVADVVSASIGWELIIPFGDTAEGQWLDAHAHEYGFAISYPEDGEEISGYIYEPWHIRYIGTACAQAWAESGMVLVRFLEAVLDAR